MKLKHVAALLVFVALATASAQTSATSNAANGNTPSATTTTAVPEYSNVIYTRGTDGSLTALPRATVKVGLSVRISFPTDAPTTTGPLIVKLEGSGDPKGILEIGCGKGFKKPLGFDAKNLGDRVFQLTLATTPATECVVAFKATGFGLPSDMFAFRTAAGK